MFMLVTKKMLTSVGLMHLFQLLIKDKGRNIYHQNSHV